MRCGGIAVCCVERFFLFECDSFDTLVPFCDCSLLHICFFSRLIYCVVYKY